MATATAHVVKSVEIAKGDTAKGVPAKYAIVVDGKTAARFEVGEGPKGKNWRIIGEGVQSPPLGWYAALDWAKAHAAELVGEARVAAAVDERSSDEVGEDEKYGITEVAVWVCEDCGEVSEDVNEAPLYECSEDGLFNRDNSADGSSHKCPTCNKFASKAGDRSCSACDLGPVDEETRWRFDGSDELYDTRQDAVDAAIEEAGDEEPEEVEA
jgi:hypothetical protein